MEASYFQLVTAMLATRRSYGLYNNIDRLKSKQRIKIRCLTLLNTISCSRKALFGAHTCQIRISFPWRLAHFLFLAANGKIFGWTRCFNCVISGAGFTAYGSLHVRTWAKPWVPSSSASPSGSSFFFFHWDYKLMIFMLFYPGKFLITLLYTESLPKNVSTLLKYLKILR